ncbi:17473_t:CDS:2 [Racocetra fulgida]|uniref:17473_t:CDS:1 n=1 Tax=Racocetra fulgida TaxID=60492 RepID=A0A9N9BYY7_9GLOM|nr:17473_t:CDS:2 [Racocetra fulgida]
MQLLLPGEVTNADELLIARMKNLSLQQMYPLTGLNLLRLLSQNRIAEFHTALENIEPEQLLENPFIKHPVHLEQYLMEGSYKKVWNSREQVPAPEYLFFIDILMGTIRCKDVKLTNSNLEDHCAKRNKVYIISTNSENGEINNVNRSCVLGDAPLC